MADFRTLTLAVEQLSVTAGETYDRIEVDDVREYLSDLIATLDNWSSVLGATAPAEVSVPPIPPGTTEFVIATIERIAELPDTPPDGMQRHLLRIDLDLQRIHQVLSTLPAGAPAPLPPPPRPSKRRIPAAR